MMLEMLQLTRAIENIFLTGSVDALQNWSPDKALALSSANYPTWSGKCTCDVVLGDGYLSDVRSHCRRPR